MIVDIGFTHTIYFGEFNDLMKYIVAQSVEKEEIELSIYKGLTFGSAKDGKFYAGISEVPVNERIKDVRGYINRSNLKEAFFVALKGTDRHGRTAYTGMRFQNFKVDGKKGLIDSNQNIVKETYDRIMEYFSE